MTTEGNSPIPHSATRTIDRLHRLANSTNGNPRYCVFFTDGSSAVTQSDSSLSYSIQNRKFYGVPLEVTLDRAGRIISLNPVS